MNNTLADYQDKWKELVRKSFTDFSSLTRDERVWFTVQCLIDSINNGGLISHYYNYGADWNKETIEDLNSLGFSFIADLLKKVNHLFPNGMVPIDIDERNDIISGWPDEYDNLFDELDRKFYSYEEGLETSLIKHIETKIN